MSVICYKCRRSIEPLERREKKGRKIWTIIYCPFERCAANLDLIEAKPMRIWNGSYFVNELDGEENENDSQFNT